MWLSAGEAVSGLITDRGRVAFDLKLPLISEAMPNGEWRMACLYRSGFVRGVLCQKPFRLRRMQWRKGGHYRAFSRCDEAWPKQVGEREGFVSVYTFTSQSVLVKSQGRSSRQEPRERSWSRGSEKHSLAACSSLVTQPAFSYDPWQWCCLECAGPPTSTINLNNTQQTCLQTQLVARSLKSDSLLPDRSGLYQTDKKTTQSRAWEV